MPTKVSKNAKKSAPSKQLSTKADKQRTGGKKKGFRQQIFVVQEKEDKKPSTPFKIGYDIPIPEKKGKYSDLIAQLKRTFENMKPNGHFTIETSKIHIVRKVVKEEYPQWVLVVSTLPADKGKWSRVFRKS